MIKLKTKSDLLKDIIIENCIKKGDYTLSSGIKSDIYIDLKPLLFISESLYRIKDVVIQQALWDINCVGGKGIGALPIIISLIQSGIFCSRGFILRDYVKSHGTQQVIEGNLYEHDNVLIVDDVVTTGESVMEVVKTVKYYNGRVRQIISIVDREQGAEKRFKEEGLLYTPLFKISEFNI